MVRVNPTQEPPLPAVALRQAVSQADQAFVVIDATRAALPVVWANSAFEALIGVPPGTVVGRPAGSLIAGSSGAQARARLRGVLADGGATTVELTGERPDGVSFPARLRLSPVRDGDRITHWFGELSDLTAEAARELEHRAVIADAQAARAANLLVGQIGDLLADREDPLVLRDVASLLRYGFLEWAEFFLDDEDLHPADGISWFVGVTARASPQEDDPVGVLLAGPPTGPTIDLDLTAPWAPGTVTAELVARARVRWSRTDFDHRTIRLTALPGRTRVLGLLAWVPRPAPSPTGPGDGESGVLDRAQGLVTFVARRVGLTVENSRAYALEHRLAQTLQRAMLPEPRSIEGLDTWAYYAPGATSSQVGGDWYEIVPDPPGAVVVIGDVAGHDIEAAAIMGQLRSIVRAYAVERAGPAAILDRVDRLLAVTPLERIAGLVVVTLTPGDGGTWVARYSRAGHLAPLLVGENRATTLTDAAGHLIGVPGGPRPEGEVVLQPGEALVLFTDGLIESRDRPLVEGIAALEREAARAVVVDAASLGEDLVAHAGTDLVDDVALVVVRVPDPVGDADGGLRPRRRRWELPHDPASIAEARRVVVHQCAAWGLPDLSAVELAVSELVGNAVLHGWGSIVLRVEDTGEGARIEVSDSNPTPPVPVTGLTGRVGGYGVRILEHLGEWGWRPTAQGKTVWARVRSRGGEDRGDPTDG